MRFTTLVLALSAAAITSAAAVEKRTSPIYWSTYYDLRAATTALDYLTDKLAPTISACLEACNSVVDCKFVNTYRKGGSLLLTCSMYSSCHGPDSATDTGGQTQPGTNLLDFITNSDGWCK